MKSAVANENKASDALDLKVKRIFKYRKYAGKDHSERKGNSYFIQHLPSILLGAGNVN